MTKKGLRTQRQILSGQTWFFLIDFGSMVSYNPNAWFAFIFNFHKADTFRKLLPAIAGIAAYCAAVIYLETDFWKIPETSHVKNLTVMHSLLGFVISMLLVFRTNTAYERWWEGRKLWGELVNNSRTFAVKMSAFISDAQEQKFFADLLGLYARTLRNHLQGQEHDLQELAGHGIKAEFINHVPNLVAKTIAGRIARLYKAKKISGEQLLALNGELQAFTAICGGCERIKNTPIPYSYSAFIKKFIFFYTMTMPFGHAFTLGYLTIPVVIFIFYVLASLELIAEEIEDPFGTDPNDLPLTQISTNIQNNTAEILTT